MVWWTVFGRLYAKKGILVLPIATHSLKNAKRLSRFSRLYRGINAPILMEAPKRFPNSCAPVKKSLIDYSEGLPNLPPTTNGGNSIETCSASTS